MMDVTLLHLVLACLIVIVAINLTLTFRLFGMMRTMNMPGVDVLPLTLPVDEQVPYFAGETLMDKTPVRSINKPTVLVFLSTQCKECHGKLPELCRIQAALRRAEVEIWLIMSEHPDRIKSFLADTPLLNLVVSMDNEVRKSLNPRTASPFYLFLDENRVLQASGMIGDHDWISFISQMDDILTEAESAL
ncbi:redoxin domain-containing protein [Shewanella sp. CG12_big_fil_rev_8_21_14_0_65_47_15]|uniref:TlpA family protein disulfide reductase n=1 Tax=Shewanella sp. CG12_big_fil_rev_8_21_14_0_65_47_15 TaxID=1975537 RepID=UPI000CAD8F88|nr:redoxin domain-containing protein [Shewanella sp. CG12_big_fil_rev_8_21_14_0_65_47_15]PIW61588.1 MAG: hypothetical protein COW15_07635 [Shewanella sp. CG12_big_fil_rev_8_21_14_0_65_47_15]